MFLKSKNKEALSDLDLVRQFKLNKNPDAVGYLYGRYVALVYGLCLRYLVDREMAKDATMQIFELLMTELQKHEITHFKSWLYVLSKNFCLMEMRKQKTLRKKEEIWLENEKTFMEYPEVLHPIDRDPDPELDKLLHDCIEKLKDEQRQCIQLFYIESKSYRQITVDTGLDEKKVKSLLQNGKRNLKICLDGKQVR